jgi:DNA polymerase III alpha subunit
MIGQVRHRGKAASGYALPGKMEMPIERIKNDSLNLGVALESSANDDLGKFGSVKLDLLSLNALDALAYMEKLTT